MKVWKPVTEISMSELEGTLAAVAERLSDLISRHGEDAKLAYHMMGLDPYFDSPCCTVEIFRDETPKEEAARLLKEQEQRDRQEKWERETYEHLQKKFGPKQI
jgi:hypothetical protein